MSNRQEFIDNLSKLSKEEMLERYVALLDSEKLTDYVAELEAKLADKDQAIEGLQEINKSLGQTCNNDAKEIERLREQLAEKDAEVQSWKDGTMVVKLGKLEEQLAEKDAMIEYLKDEKDGIEQANECLNKMFIEVKEELAEKEKEHELLIDQFEEETEKLRKQIKQESDARKRFVNVVKELKQSQNQTAIAKLQKVIKFMKTRNKWGFFPQQNDIADYIDQQITELKGEKDGKDNSL